MGIALARGADGIGIAGGQRLRALEIALPGDPSSAAFLLVAALAVPGSSIRIRDVGLNPTRTGAFDILRRMRSPPRFTAWRPTASGSAKASSPSVTSPATG